MGLPRHVSGSLKQSNKKHKGERKRSNSQRFQKTYKKSGHSQSKKIRRHIAKQQRQQKNKIVITSQKNSSAPLMCLILPLHEKVDVELTQLLICKSDPNSSLRQGILSENPAFEVKYLNSPLVKRDFALVTGQSTNMFGCLDLARLADWIIFVLPGDVTKLQESRHLELLTALYAQGLPSSVFCVMSNVSDTKDLLSVIETKFPVTDGKIRPLNSTSDAIGLLRHLSQSQKKLSFSTANNYLSSSVALKVGTSATRLRCGMLVEGLSTEKNEDNEAEAYLKLDGLLRGWDLPLFDISQPHSEKSVVGCPFIHVSGWGDFPLRSACWRDYRRPSGREDQSATPQTSWTAISGPNEELANSLSAAWNDLQIDAEDSDVTLSEDSSDNEETEDEMSVDAASANDAASESDEDISDFDTENADSDPKKSVSFQNNIQVKKVPRSNLTTIDERIKAARLEQEFPDEVETPSDVSARIRFSKYRGLPSFSKCCWSVENDTSLPYEYGKIFRFHNYAHNRRTMIKHTLSQLRKLSSGQIVDPLGVPLRIPSGSIATLTLGPITKTIASAIINAHTISDDSKLNNTRVQPLVLWSLLPYEHCMSVLHLTMQKRQAETDLAMKDVDKNFDADPILSKEPMLFQVGIRRFMASPIYSQANKASNTNSKLEKFFTSNSSPIVSSMYAPVTYAPQSVLQFRVNPMEKRNSHNLLSVGPLVATGSILSVDPSRAIVKRILLSGHPFKINKRSAIARYMFHTPEDIDYFMPIQLYTKSGAVGHIKQSVGTHGLMKCLFDRQLSAADVILMPLYKRVFPKMTYDCMISPKIVGNVVFTARSSSNSDSLHGVLKHNKDLLENPCLTSEEEAMFL